MTGTASASLRRGAVAELPAGLARRRACELLDVPRTSTYYEPSPEPAAWPEADERRARAIDEAHVDHPEYGARKLAALLTAQGLPTTRWKARELMRRMGIESTAPRPSLSRPSKGSRRFPYLLGNKPILFPNQAWSVDVTYVQLGGRHMYLTAVIDWFSRYIVGWKLSDTMRACEVVGCVREAFDAHGTPGVLNSDQGSVFGSDGYVSLLASRFVPQSMDGRARWVDNVRIERWCRTLRSEGLRSGEYSTPTELEREIGNFVRYYNERRMHQSLGYETPASWYCGGFCEAA